MSGVKPIPGMAQQGDAMDDTAIANRKKEEWRTFLFLAVVTAPVLAVMVVGGYGFAVWMFQLLSGQLPSG
jgi:nitrate reductase NapE